MPPTARFAKEQIVEAAFSMTRAKGIEALNARSLAKQLHCSTQPLFRVYDSMEHLKQDVIEKADAFYNTHMMQGLEHPIPFLGMGLAYVAFAKTEKPLFRLLFLHDRFAIHSFHDMLEGEDNRQIIERIAHATQLSPEQARRVFLHTWLLTHGIATMVATNNADVPTPEVEQILLKGFRGFLSQEKEGTSKNA